MDEKKIAGLPQGKASDEQLDATLEEFSIMELDERMEFVAWCDNCSCPPRPSPQ